MRQHRPLEIMVLLLLGAGLVLHGYTALGHLTGARDLAFSLGVLLWSLLPYAAAALLDRGLHLPCQALGWLLAVVAADVFTYRSVFVHPQSSTAALGLLFTPVWNLILVGPAGATLGWIMRILVERRLRN